MNFRFVGFGRGMCVVDGAKQPHHRRWRHMKATRAYSRGCTLGHRQKLHYVKLSTKLTKETAISLLQCSLSDERSLFRSWTSVASMYLAAVLNSYDFPNKQNKLKYIKLNYRRKVPLTIVDSQLVALVRSNAISTFVNSVYCCRPIRESSTAYLIFQMKRDNCQAGQ